eukprot:m.347536 g.347536  ORF g.347536 m.347536 type:complete len:129 (+) comp20669_c0_seq2:92-478(+)
MLLSPAVAYPPRQEQIQEKAVLMIPSVKCTYYGSIPCDEVDVGSTREQMIKSAASKTKATKRHATLSFSESGEVSITARRECKDIDNTVDDVILVLNKGNNVIRFVVALEANAKKLTCPKGRTLRIIF